MILSHMKFISRSLIIYFGRVIFTVLSAVLVSFSFASYDSEAGEREEFTCISQVDGKIPWNVKGNTNWAPKNIAKLCMGVEDVSARLNCFKNEVTQKGVRWDIAISNCQLNEVNERLRSGWDPKQPLAQKYLQLEALVVHKRTEKSNDEVYIKVSSDSNGSRIPEVAQYVEKAQQITPFIESTDQRKYAYYSMEMTEDDSRLNTWNICKVYSPTTVMTVAVMEKDDVYVEEDRKRDDLIGFLPIAMPGLKPGRYVTSMTGDGGNYSLVYNVAVKRDVLPACEADPIRDPDLKNRSLVESPCEKFCSANAVGDGLKSCPIGPSEECANMATAFFACIGFCEARGGPPN